MYIVENECLEEIRKIWIENNSGYIGNNCNLRSIKDNNMLKVVCKTDTDVCGYAVLYFEKDFCELEKYPNNIENMPKKTIYMWEMVTSKNHLKEGVASKIYDYIKTKFNDYTIYAAIDEKNIPSLNLHIKEKFIPIYNFYKDDENVNYIMYEWNKVKESNKMNKDKLIIKNIIEYISKLELITKDKDESFFFNDTNEFNKIINNVVKIGECLSKISDETKNKYPYINWDIIKEKSLDEEKVGHEMNVKDTYDLASKLLKEELYDKLIELIKR